jgi:hypothetical protein
MIMSCRYARVATSRFSPATQRTLRAWAFVTFGATMLLGQGERRGTVTAAGGLGIEGAVVESSCGPSTVTNEAGAFALPLEAACTISVRAAGFVAWSQPAGTIPGGDLRVVLSVNPLIQTVTVMESSPLVSASPEVSKAIDGRTLAELPSINRDINRFAMLDPRVRNTSSLASDGLHSTRLTINGQLFRYTQYEIDGSSNYEPVLGNGPQQTLSIAAVAEYKVLLNQFGADHGRSAAGVVTAVTKVGGDQWHGEAFYFGRPSGIQAAPPVSTFRMPNERQQFGGAAGGKIASRAHIFASVEAGLQTRGSYIQSPKPSFYPGHQRQVFGLVNADYQPTDKQSLYQRQRNLERQSERHRRRIRPTVGARKRPWTEHWRPSDSSLDRWTGSESVPGRVGEQCPACLLCRSPAGSCRTSQLLDRRRIGKDLHQGVVVPGRRCVFLGPRHS